MTIYVISKGRQGRKIVMLMFLMLLLKKYLLKINSNKCHKKKIGVDFSIFKNQSLNKRIFTYFCR